MNARKMRWPLCAVGCACIALIVVAALRAPETEGAGVATVAFSHASGFYDAPFELALSAEGGTIYYTLDSSDPDEHGIAYTGPIPIGDASESENVYSMNRDVALELNAELLTDAGFKLKYPYEVPEEKVDKATVVRAVCVDAYGNRGATAEGVYFVGFDAKPGYDGLNVVTVTTDPDNLFDPEIGIYVLGNAFTAALVDGKLPIGADQNYTFMPANYYYRGRNWEREVGVCFFDADRRLVASGHFGIRLQGHGSKAKLPKSLNLFAREAYGASSVDVSDLLGVDYALERLNLSSGSQDADSLLKDGMVNALCADLAFGTREYAPCALFLDGEYWGVYWLTPRYKKDYLSQKYGVLGDDIVVYHNTRMNSDANRTWEDNQHAEGEGRIEVGQASDMALYDAMRGFITCNDMGVPENYARACELIDIESCLDYYAVEIYIANKDWPHNNVALWRTRGVAPGAYSDGRWRWLLFDVNIGMNAGEAKLNCVQRTMERDDLFRSLMASEAFSEALYARLARLAREVFSMDRVDAWIDRHEALLDDQMQLKNRRFYNGQMARSYFIDNCEGTRAFFARRNDYILTQYGDRYE